LPDPDIQRSLPQLSVFFPWQIVVYLIGLVNLFKKSSNRKLYWLIFLTAPVAAALAKDPFSVLRASLIIVPTALAVIDGIFWANSKLSRLHMIIVTSLVVTLSMAALYRSLFILLPNERHLAWLYGYNKLFTFLAQSNLPAVIDVDKPVYILYLFYQKIDPKYVQSLSNIPVSSYYSYSDWSNYYRDAYVEFRGLNWQNDIYKKKLIVGNDLLVSTTQANEHALRLVFTVKQKFNQPSLFVYQTDPTSKCASQATKIPQCLLE